MSDTATGADSAEAPTGATSTETGAENLNSDAAANNVGTGEQPSSPPLGGAETNNDSEFAKEVIKQYSEDAQQNRKFRYWVVLSSIIMSSFTLIFIFISIGRVFYCIDIDKILTGTENIKLLSLVPIDFLMLTTVIIFITIFVAVVRFVEPRKPKDTPTNPVSVVGMTKPATDVTKSFSDLVTALASLAKSLKDTVKAAKP